ncbi:hypothetical protein SHANETTE_172 [Bacillus phage Shanette]|uniref:Uncharacterized protein n=2 Tax=Siminovitchvirus TaxID=1918721 RepID=S5MMB6_9CAUD|nr:hypothetical protein AVV47_gp125 [Bacillus phage JL]YP_009216167.1 hypothetical protein AVV46_gp125 [Bacillus phage Shanette]AGR46840.1 hypothetical protein JL_171 [Bacillus phage JL]AGR47066.1 hypothetical protein SHANETTE_172 [Bacillus phage Shanette]
MLGIRRLKVPVTTYHDVDITTEHLVELLDRERKSLLPPGWDCLVFYKDKVTIYRAGYGSHDIGEKEEDFTDEKVIHNYSIITATIKYLKGENK